MPSFCVVVSCEQKYTHSKNISFHKFPYHSENVLKKWIDFTGRGNHWKPSKWSAICSRHFLPGDFRDSETRKCLKRDAVPSVTIQKFKPSLLQKFSREDKTHCCRLCGKFYSRNKITIMLSTNYEVYEMIQKCLPMLNVQQNDEVLPKYVCPLCYQCLQNFSDFIDNALSVQKGFEKKLETTKVLKPIESISEDYRATAITEEAQNSFGSNTNSDTTMNMNSNIKNEKPIKIKQEPVINVKQENLEYINKNIENLDSHENEEIINTEQQQQEEQYNNENCLVDLTTKISSSAQDIINNCDVMEIISLDDVPIDIIDDDYDTSMTETQLNTNAPPKTIKQNFENFYQNWDHTYIKQSENVNTIVKKNECIKESFIHSINQCDQSVSTNDIQENVNYKDGRKINVIKQEFLNKPVLKINLDFKLIDSPQSSCNIADATTDDSNQTRDKAACPNGREIIVIKQEIFKKPKVVTNFNQLQSVVMDDPQTLIAMDTTNKFKESDIVVTKKEIPNKTSSITNSDLKSNGNQQSLTDTIASNSNNNNIKENSGREIIVIKQEILNKPNPGFCFYNIFNCDKCNLQFLNEEHLKLHQSSYHFENIETKSDQLSPKNSLKPLLSLQSTLSSSTSSLPVSESSEILDIHVKDFKCTICNDQFKTAYEILKHKVDTHNYKRITKNLFTKSLSSKSNFCSNCGKHFTNKLALNNHRKYICEKLLTDANGNSNKNVIKNSYKCRFCKNRFDRWILFKNHKLNCNLNRTKKIEIINTNNDHVTASTNDNVKNPSYPIHSCNLCGRNYSRRSNLEKHINQHRPINQWNLKCIECDRLFDRIHDLRRHLNSIECRGNADGNKVDWIKYVCTVCEKEFRTIQRLKVHYEIHSNEKHYICEICDKRFYCIKNLQQHYVTHTDLRRYKCDQCDKKFKRCNGLSQHKKSIHLNLKPHECPVCNHKYALKNDMLRCRHSNLKSTIINKKKCK